MPGPELVHQVARSLGRGGRPGQFARRMRSAGVAARPEGRRSSGHVWKEPWSSTGRDIARFVADARSCAEREVTEAAMRGRKEAVWVTRPCLPAAVALMLAMPAHTPKATASQAATNTPARTPAAPTTMPGGTAAAATASPAVETAAVRAQPQPPPQAPAPAALLPASVGAAQAPPQAPAPAAPAEVGGVQAPPPGPPAAPDQAPAAPPVQPPAAAPGRAAPGGPARVALPPSRVARAAAPVTAQPRTGTPIPARRAVFDLGSLALISVAAAGAGFTLARLAARRA